MPLVYPGNYSSGKEVVPTGMITKFRFPLVCPGSRFALNSNDAAYQYQNQKIIQNTVRVPASLYMSDLGALSTYQSPSAILGTGVNWNQMSDRALPHNQTNSSWSQGSAYHGSSTKHTQTKDRPGAMTPGGSGVDIKHNSYYRYMNRLKAKRDIRRGRIPPSFGAPVPFNPALPVYGGKTVKTSIVAGCKCGPLSNESAAYGLYGQPVVPTSDLYFQPGQRVYARSGPQKPFLEASIVSILGDDAYQVKFKRLDSSLVVPAAWLVPFFPCDCPAAVIPPDTKVVTVNGLSIDTCPTATNVTENAFNALISQFFPQYNVQY